VRAGRIFWDSFQADQMSIASRVNFPDICSSCREYRDCIQSICACMLSILPDLLYTGISCCFALYSSDDQLL
jgi:hypothetical protein